MNEYQQQTEMMIKCSRLLSVDVAGIIISYIRHPYYDIAKRMIPLIKVDTHEEGSAVGVDYTITSILTYGGDHRYAQKYVNRIADVVWNIKCIMPKKEYTSPPYTMTVYIGQETNIFASETCHVSLEGDNYILQTPSASIPIPISALYWHDVRVIIKGADGSYDHTSSLSVEGINMISKDKRQEIACMGTDGHCILSASGGIFSGGMYGSYEDGKYSKIALIPGKEFFPGMRSTNKIL